MFPVLEMQNLFGSWSLRIPGGHLNLLLVPVPLFQGYCPKKRWICDHDYHLLCDFERFGAFGADFVCMFRRFGAFGTDFICMFGAFGAFPSSFEPPMGNSLNPGSPFLAHLDNFWLPNDRCWAAFFVFWVFVCPPQRLPTSGDVS